MATVIDPVCGMRIEADRGGPRRRHRRTPRTDLLLLLGSLPPHLRFGSSAHGAPGLTDTDADRLTEQEVGNAPGSAPTEGRSSERKKACSS